MIPLGEWTRSCPLPDRPWLVLGKGPSFARRHAIDLSRYNTAALNHVVREQKVDVAHFIDLDAAAACADVLPQNADWLILPRYPHIDFCPSDCPLEDLLDTVPVLRDFADRGRLVWYYHDLVSRPDLKGRYPPGAAPLIRVEAFSAEAIVSVLATLGAKVVRTLGVDGGIHYAGAFHDLNGVTRLANGQSSFDRQFIGIHRTVKENGMDYGPLPEPIRVYVGTDDSQMVAARVLEFSIRKFATRPVEVVPMLNLPVPTPRDPANRPRTGFSFARFLIPSLAGYRGRAVYLDADMLVFGDIAELWDLPMGAHRVLCTRQDQPPRTWQNNAHFQPGRQMSVMLLDCGRLDWKIEDIVRGLDEGRYNYRQLLCDLCIVPHDEIGESMPPEWNCLEHFTAGRTRLLHYTDMGMQPWRHRHNPLQSIWRAYYRAAVEAGAVEPELVEQGIAAGHLLPELAEDLRYAPGRRAADDPVSQALEGAPAVRQRSLELELAALRAEVGILRTEAEILRHDNYQQHLVAGHAGEHANILVQKVHDLTAQVAYVRDLEAQVAYVAAQADAQRRRTDQVTQMFEQHIQELHQRFAQQLAQQRAELEASWTWKIGHGLTRPLRVINRLRKRAA